MQRLVSKVRYGRFITTRRSRRFASSQRTPRPPPDAAAESGDALRKRKEEKVVIDRMRADIEDSVKAIQRDVLFDMNEALMGPLEKDSQELTRLPFVFLLGNHSSGKSSFINYVLNRRVQETGVAPTDDGFTIIAPGPKDMDQDGHALIGDPDLGFSSLRGYGPGLMRNLRLKVRNDIATPDFMLVDSPGMIDSPLATRHDWSEVAAGTAGGLINEEMSMSARGYNFQSVVRWFAERADVILLLVDPDKPGTTGETLSVLTNSLVGLEHKMKLVLNKTDRFTKIHDFARAYGSLCWNLSKVIHQKDLPRIYTTCIPCPENNYLRPLDVATSSSQQNDSNQTTESNLITEILPELTNARNELLEEVYKAPFRRVDNIITRLYDSARLLQMHAVVGEAARSRYSTMRWRWNLASACMLGGSGTLAMMLAVSLPAAEQIAIGTAVLGLVGTAGVATYGRTQMEKVAAALASDRGLTKLFELCYASQLADGDAYVPALWHRVKPQLRAEIATIGFEGMEKVSSAELARLSEVVNEDVPSLRRQAAQGRGRERAGRMDTPVEDPDHVPGSGFLGSVKSLFRM